MNARILFPASVALTLVACGQQSPSAPAGEGTGSDVLSTPTGSPPPTPGETGANPTKADPLSGENDGYPDLTPAPSTGDAARSETGARAILLTWARGIELREFDQSWAMMGDAAKAQIGKAEFNALFHPLHDLVVAVPNGTMEGAAGSSYYTVPTIVTGTRADGTEATLKGDVVLRRVNDVPGATPEQLTWHIEQVNLTPG